MRSTRTRFVSTLALMLLPLLLVGMVACEDSDEYHPAPVAAPDTSYVSVPTPLPESARVAVEDFANQKIALDSDWDALQDEFDQWKIGLTDCHGGAIYEALRGFAVESASVAQFARDLPPSTTTRDLAEALVEAAEQEEEAYRRLRDRWQPNNLSLFEAVEQRRTQSAKAQQQVANGIAELRDSLEEAPIPEDIADFARSFNSLKARWKDFHDDYRALIRAMGQLQEEIQLEGDRSEMGASETELDAVLERLQGIPREFEDIVDGVDRLPSLEVVETEIEELGAAASTELDALQEMAVSLSDRTVLPLAQVEVAIERSEALLGGTTEALKEIEGDDPDEGLADLQEFEAAYIALAGKWVDFHGNYNDWRKTEGGCDRTRVLQALDEFAIDFASLGRKVRSLPQASHLLPIHRLLTDAIAREEGSMRALRNSWRPFTVDVFKAVDVERANSDRLRRDANIALEELNERFP